MLKNKMVELKNRHYFQQEELDTFGNLAPIDFGALSIPKPKRLDMKTENLPDVDCLAVVWTDAEFAALNHVFNSFDKTISVHNALKAVERSANWHLYKNQYDDFIGNTALKGAVEKIPSSYNSAWGKVSFFEANGIRILLIKSDMHPSTDGLISSINNSDIGKELELEINQTPITVLIQKLIKDTNPKLIYTTGTAGGTVVNDILGTVNITNEAICKLRVSHGIDFAQTVYKGHLMNNMKYTSLLTKVALASENELFTPVPGDYKQIKKIAESVIRNFDNSDLADEDFYNKGINFNLPTKLQNFSKIKPVLSTNTYEIATTSGNHSMYMAQEMDDAFVAVVANYYEVPFVVIRNISDPVVNAKIGNLEGKDLEKAQKIWSSKIYEKYGIYTSVNSALSILYMIKYM